MESIRSRPHRGFSLIELLVVLTIIVVVMMIVFTSEGAFNKSLVLANTAYDIALTFRLAETYGLGSRALGTTANTGYGLHFAKATNSSYILFADTDPPVGSGTLCHPAPGYDSTGPNAIPGDCIYRSGLDTSVQTYSLGNQISISNICAQVSGVWKCSTTLAKNLSTLDIVFSRPNPNSLMSVNGSYAGAGAVTAACITLTSMQSTATGPFRYISVAASGQVNANAASCP